MWNAGARRTHFADTGILHFCIQETGEETAAAVGVDAGKTALLHRSCHGLRLPSEVMDTLGNRLSLVVNPTHKSVLTALLPAPSCRWIDARQDQLRASSGYGLIGPREV